MALPRNESYGARVAGYLTYSMVPGTILNAIKLIAAGEVFVPADITVDNALQFNNQFSTGREHDVLSGLLAEISNKEIALVLISARRQLNIT